MCLVFFTLRLWIKHKITTPELLVRRHKHQSITTSFNIHYVALSKKLYMQPANLLNATVLIMISRDVKFFRAAIRGYTHILFISKKEFKGAVMQII